MKKKLLWFTLSVIVVAATIWLWRSTSSPLPGPAARLEAEKEIYSMLLADASYNNLEDIPLAEYTTLGRYEEEVTTKAVPLMVNWLLVIKREAIIDLQKNNRQSYSIRDYLPSQISERMIGQQGEWISFSRIGFDARLTQALVVREEYFGCASNVDCYHGEGSFLFLRKIAGKWLIEIKLGSWEMHTDPGA